MSGIEALVELLGNARLERRQISALPEGLAPQSEEEGYRVQEGLTEWLAAAGLGRPRGYKVGLVSASMRASVGGQAILGVDCPVYGAIPEKCIYERRAELVFSDFIRPYVEGEIAVRVGRSLEVANAPFTPEAVADHVSECFAAIELVDWRMPYMTFAPPLAPLMIADSGSNWGCVLGRPVCNWRSLDLSALAGAMVVNGREVGRGKGRDLQGNPLSVLAWLANKLATHGRGLRAGDIVLLGSVTPSEGTFKRGTEVVVEWEALGAVSVRFN